MAALRVRSLLYTLPCILTSSLVAAQNGDGGAASGNIPASSASGSIAGASGGSSGSFTLSTGAIVAIALIVSIVVILGVLTMVLFFAAKKRQWTMRETLRRSTRRVTTGIKTTISPFSPSRATFAPGSGRTNKASRGMRGPHPLSRGEKNRGIGLVDVDMEALTGNRDGDVEKGEGSHVYVSEKKNGFKGSKPSINIAKANRKVTEPPPTPMLNRMFGRD